MTRKVDWEKAAARDRTGAPLTHWTQKPITPHPAKALAVRLKLMRLKQDFLNRQAGREAGGVPRSSEARNAGAKGREPLPRRRRR